MEQRKSRLDGYKQRLIKEKQEDVGEDCLKFFETFEDCYGEPFSDSVSELEGLLSLSDENRLKSFAEECEATSSDYAADWWDEDLECYRSGVQWESNFYWNLRNIALNVYDRNPNRVSGRI